MREPVAAITMFRGDHYWLQTWLMHYERLLGGRKNLYVILHGDDLIARDMLSGVSQIVVPHFPGDSAFERRRMRMVHRVSSGLQQYYKCVLFTDTDELVALHPRGGDDFVSYMDRLDFDGVALTCIGLELMGREHEVPVDNERPILKQRFHGILNGGYCKPNMFFQPIGRANQHRIPGQPMDIDRNIYLFHLRYSDYYRFKSTADERQLVHDEMERNGTAAVGGWASPMDGYVRKLNFMQSQDPIELNSETVEPGLRKFERLYRKKGRIGARLHGHYIVPEIMRNLA
jgi:hypothetical protein